MTVCKHVIYSGNVQGVGFRMTAHHLAEKHGVAGFVRNLPDGTVELLVEGDVSQVDGLLADLRSGMGSYITGTVVTEKPATQRSGFRITR